MRKSYLTMLTTMLSIFSICSLQSCKTEEIDEPEIATITDYLSSDEEIASYYSALNEYDLSTLKGDEFLSALQVILSENQVLVSYYGQVQGVEESQSWDNYLLLDRNWDLSPLTEEEITALESGETLWWKTDLIYVDALYEEDAVYFDRTNINRGGTNSLQREHVFPKSYGFNGINGNSNAYSSIYAGVDLHNLHMSEGNANTKHSNYPYGEVTDESKNPSSSSWSNVQNGWVGQSEAGTYVGIVYEPIEEDKGDIARSLFYMAARYHDYQDESYGEGYPNPALRLDDTPDGITSTREPSATSETPAIYGILCDLMDWNITDEVSEHEKIRNDLNYQFIQKNRNPFIDYPLWADIAFNSETTYIVDLTSPDGVLDTSLA